MRSILVVAVCSSLVLASSSQAQAAADSAAQPFHAGQWGVQFVARPALTEGGVLRFSTPTRAWILDGAATYDHTSSGGAAGPAGHSLLAFAANLGPRWYRGLGSHLVRFAGVGLSGGYSRVRVDGSSGAPSDWSVGGYGELGVTYMFTPHFGVGSRTFLGLTRTASSVQTIFNGQPLSTVHTTDYRVTFNPVEIAGAIFF